MVSQLLQKGYLLLGGQPSASDEMSGDGSEVTLSARALRGASVFAIAAVVTGLAGLIFHTLMSRALGPNDYGTLAALLNILLVAGVPLAGLELAVAAKVARSPDRPSQRANLSMLLFRSVLVGGFVSAVGAMTSMPLARFLHLSSPDPVWIAGLYLGLATIAAPLRGMLLGSMRYRRLAGSVLLAGVVKLSLGAFLLVGEASLTLAMTVLVVAELAQLVALAWGNGSAWTEPPGKVGDRLRFTSAIVPAIAMTGIWLLGTGDVIAARNVFAGDLGGMYAAAGTAAHTLLFIPQIVLQAAFPLLVRSQGPELRRRFWSTIAISFGLSGIAGAVMMTVPAPLTRIMFGSEFLTAVPLIRTLVPATLAVGLVYGVVHLHLAAGKRVAWVGWLGVAGLVAVAVAGPSTPRGFAAWVLAVSAGSAIWGLVGARRAWESTEGGDGIDLASPSICELSVVVPFFNHAPRVVGTIDGILNTFADRRADVEVVAVSDGATDGSAEMVAELAACHPRVRLIVLPTNRGKGAALRAGIADAKGEWIGFLDADGDIPPEVLGSYLDLARLYRPDAVVGCKRHRLSQVMGYPPLRQLLSIGFAFVTRLLFRLGISDTQTGAKIFRRDVLAAALPATVESGFAFDLELLVAARVAGFTQLAEAPVTISRGMSSTVSIQSGLEAVFATFRIANRALASRQDRSSAPDPVEQFSPSLAPVIVGS